jgi:hypothetical protein
VAVENKTPQGSDTPVAIYIMSTQQTKFGDTDSKQAAGLPAVVEPVLIALAAV